MSETPGNLDHLVATLFEPADANSSKDLTSACAAFQNLTIEFFRTHHPELSTFITFDLLKLGLAMQRFFREAYGVQSFTRTLAKLQRDSHITADAEITLRNHLKQLGIRINSNDPRKTRIAAAFSLWVSTMKPIVIAKRCLDQSRSLSNLDQERLCSLEAASIFWMVTVYLSRYGRVDLGIDEAERNVRMGRIVHDLTFRDLSLSSLEFMYSGLFRRVPTPAPNG